jgi:hypothetical protein
MKRYLKPMSDNDSMINVKLLYDLSIDLLFSVTQRYYSNYEMLWSARMKKFR